MMIIYGTKGKTVAGQDIDGLECRNCGNTQHVTFGILRYFHIFWIPILPISKIAGIECIHCKRTSVGKEISGDLSKQIKSTVFNKKNTAPMFAGLVIIAFLVIFSYFAVGADKKQELAYLKKPKVNDLYIVDFTKIFSNTNPTYKYGVMKVKSVSESSVNLLASTLGYNKTSGPRKDIRNYKVVHNSYYSKGTISVDIGKLQEMKENGAIYSVERIE